MTNDLAKKKLEVETMAANLAATAPTLSDLTPEQLEAVAKLVIAEKLKDELKQQVTIAGIDYQAERAKFLDSSKTGSQHTKRAYNNALLKLEAYCQSIACQVLELTPAAADDFIYNLKKQDLSAATIRQAIAAGSAFFTWLERRHNDIKNPFRGTRARPAKKAVRACQYPTGQEVEAIIKGGGQEMAVILLIMARRGLRAGAFPGLTLNGRRFTTVSKGKEITGELPAECIEAIKAAGLDLARPFQKWTTGTIETTARYYILKLFKAGKIAAVYSVHDLRHYFAVTEYKKDHDIYRVSKLLGHSSLAVTETYLKGLKVLEVKP